MLVLQVPKKMLLLGDGNHDPFCLCLCVGLRNAMKISTNHLINEP